ncbi:MAG: Coenzyme F420 hydrogenase/dehydrogenase, beta subunit C-terminal domain [Candidatus Hodarchaeota archaeon]
MSARLQQEVWALQRCSGCGVCVAVCSKGVLHWNEVEHPLMEEREKLIGLSRLKLKTCEVCENFCEAICPRLVNWTPLEPTTMVSARSKGVIQSGAPNDVARAILVAARSTELIDGVVMLDVDPWNIAPIARVATTVDEIVTGVGMQFLWAPVLSALNEAIFDFGLSKLAIFGSPCVAQGARQLMRTENDRLRSYQQSIRFILSPFCTGIYRPDLILDLLEKGKNIQRQHIQSLTMSNTDNGLKVSLWDGTEHLIPLTEVEPYTRHGCSSCDDFLGNQADIAIGTVGAQEGFSTLILRTPTGETFLQNAMRCDLLEITKEVNQDPLNAAKAEKERRGLAKAFDEFKVLSLEALGDPKKRALVRKQFVKLYGTPQARSANREKSDVSCSGC